MQMKMCCSCRNECEVECAIDEMNE